MKARILWQGEVKLEANKAAKTTCRVVAAAERWLEAQARDSVGAPSWRPVEFPHQREELLFAALLDLSRLTPPQTPTTTDPPPKPSKRIKTPREKDTR